MVVLAVSIVTSLTVDLGPSVRETAEREGSKYIERPLHIGALGIHLLSGKVRVENVRIDGVHDNDRPFFTARWIDVRLDWAPAGRAEAGFHDFVGGDDRLADAGRAMGRRPQLSALRARRRAAETGRGPSR